MMVSAAFAVEPSVIEDLYCMGLTPDGKTMVCVDESSMTLVNLETGERTVFAGNGTVDSYSLGQGNAFSDTGVMVGSGLDGTAAIYKNGEWTSLSTPKPELSSCAQGITCDGLRICGNVGMAPMSLDETATPMQVPVVWDLQPDGSYGEAVRLPYPETDFTGRVPQYVMAVSISDDGRTVVGQIIDYSGGYPTLIIYRLGDDNQWTYDVSYNRLVNPNNVAIPEYPGEGPEPPSQTSFMSEEELADWTEAYNAWIASGYSGEFPEYENYMTPEEIEAYQAALAAYNEAYEAWNIKNTAFMEAFSEAVVDARPLVMNNIRLSPDGVKAYSTATVEIEVEGGWFPEVHYTPVVFDLAADSYRLYPDCNIVFSGVTDDGTMFGFFENDSSPRVARVYLPGSDEPISLYDYYVARDAELAAWIKENMYHDCEMMNPETYEMEMVEDVEFTGTPFVNSKANTVATAVQNYWDMMGCEFYSYVLPGFGTGVKGVVSDRSDVDVKAFRGGRIAISGMAERVTVYDAEGRLAYEAVPVGNVIETGLAAGAYIVKVKTAEGDKVLKAIF